MNSTFPQREQLHNLLDRLLANRLSDTEVQQLNAMLEQSEVARREYVLYLSLEGRLAWEACELPPSIDLKYSKAAGPVPAQRSSRHSLLTTFYWRAHPARFAAMALALTLLLWAGVGYLVIPRLNGPPEKQITASNTVAAITNIQSVMWAEGAEIYASKQSLAAGDTLSLQSGFVEITFQDGAVVLLQAPVKFTVDTRGAGTLETGRLVARMEKQAERSGVVPFAISTPLAQIIDLGTEFGVEVAGDGTTHVEVLEGRVEASARGEAKTRTSRPLRLVQGQSAHFLPGNGGLQLEDSDRQFVRDLPEEAGDLRGYPVVNYRRFKMHAASVGVDDNIGVYSAHTTRQENTLLEFDLRLLAGARAAGAGRLTFTVMAGGGAVDPGSFELELRQLNSYNAAVDLDTSDSYFLDGVSARWRDNSGAEMNDLSYSNAVLDITSGLVAMRRGPFAGDTPTTDPPPGSQIVFTIPQATLQSWLDQTAPPILVLTANSELPSADGSGRIETTRVETISFGTGGAYPLPVLKFEVVDPAAETATDGDPN